MSKYKQARSQHEAGSTQNMAGLATYCIPVSCLSYSSTMKMKAVRSSETSVDFQRISWRYIPRRQKSSEKFLGFDG
jgi:hypothetical protein